MNWIWIVVIVGVVLFILSHLVKVKLMELKAHCDDCDYDEVIDPDEHIHNDFNDLLGKVCPKCGHIMVNKNDLKQLKRMYGYYDKDVKGKGIGFNIRTKKH